MSKLEFDGLTDMADVSLLQLKTWLQSCKNIDDFYKLYFDVSAELAKRKDERSFKKFNVKVLGEYCSVKDAAAFLGVSERTIRRYMANNKLPYTKTKGGGVLLKQSDLMAFVKGQGLNLLTQTGDKTNDEILSERLDGDAADGR